MAERLGLTKKERGWILYDCGNSAYSLAITTALFPVYFGMFSGSSGMNLGYFNSAASLFVALLSPILGAVADYKGFKKRFFMFFALMGILFTGAIALVPDGQWLALGVIYILTTIGFAGANIFYDAFLVDVTEDDQMDAVSTKGFAYGYIASVIPFMASLAIIYFLGFENLLGFRLGFLVTMVWWGLFTLPMLRHVKQVHYVEPEPRVVISSFKRLGHTFRNIRQYRHVFVFMIAYFFYIDGVGTIIKMAMPFATDVLGLNSEDIFLLLGILLLIQIIAFPCALAYGYLAKRFGTRTMIVVGIVTYIVATLFAYAMQALWHIFVLGAMIGSAQGGIQALSRSYYAKIIPKKNANEFFGFYNIFGKFAAILGPLLLSSIATVTGSARLSILGILPLFVIGLVVFLLLPKEMQHSPES